ncbi:hypothetical protein E8D34_04845 [Nocardioides sp. GY 10113]|uniref:sensor histidine kinase n=1 Tax=Nocardioides sp. GY 10113 TaxID=2569761 RepID=UPI0010A88BD4|nr:sensor histidine kinase [Nocardioides sp. GY 10113]TIC88271.1 hypothetical protein E8D34_04845 [Nocardioides sp. GY 10113]
MGRPSGVDSAVVGLVAASAGVCAVHTVVQGAGPAEWLFGSVCLAALLLLLRHTLRDWRATRAQARVARDLAAAEPVAYARRAVLEERTRLAEDIAASLRDCLAEVGRDAADAARAADPLPAVRRIHLRAQEASSELRRHLGLLRTSLPPAAGAPPSGEAPRGRDLVLGATIAALACVEATVYPRVEGDPFTWVGAALTVLAAGTVALRRSAPRRGALVAAGAYLLGLAFTAPLSGGFWVLATIGGLLWTLAARCARARSARGVVADGAALAALVAAASASTAALDGENVGVMLVLMALACVGGASSGALARHRRRHRDAAQERETALAAAAHEAVVAERLAFARDLHDVVSHTVGLVALQAGAAEVSWPDHPEATRGALRVIADACAGALAELNRLDGGVEPWVTCGGDLRALVARVRASGTEVDAVGLDLVPDSSSRLVYRIVQECLTNVMRHAPGARARIEVTSGPGGLTVAVSDTGPGPDLGAERGFGLLGLAERVGYSGGRLASGRAADGGGFRVEAVLPEPSGVGA